MKKIVLWIGIAIAGIALLLSPIPNVAEADGGIHGWVFFGTIRPSENPHWCLTMTQFKTGARVVLVPCAHIAKGISADPNQNWVGIKVLGVGYITQMSTGDFVLAQLGKKNYVVGVDVGQQPTANWHLNYYSFQHGDYIALGGAGFMTAPPNLKVRHLFPYYARWIRPSAKPVRGTELWFHNPWIPYAPGVK